MSEREKIKNIRVGEIWAILLLSKLIESWPSARNFKYEEIDEMLERSGVAVEYGDDSKAFHGLIAWLENENYLRVKLKTSSSLHGCTLTEKALTRLNQMPSGIAGSSLRDTVVQAAADITKDAAKETIKSQMPEMFGQIIGGITRSWTNG